MSTEAQSAPEAENPPKPKAPVRKKKKKGGKRAKLARPLTEREINAPDTQTLVMLGVLAATSIVLWIFAHAACNYHPPRETRRPRDVKTAELVREPKDAAIEFQQRFLTLDYKGALEIAAGPLVDTVKREQAQCEANRAACNAKRAARANVISAGVLLERGPSTAKVRVSTLHLPDGDKAFLCLVERDPSGWKVTAAVQDTPGATLPNAVLPPMPAMHMNVIPAPPGAASGPSARPGLMPHMTPLPAKPTAPPGAAPAPTPAPGSSR
jgi:hypothetical protein